MVASRVAVVGGGLAGLSTAVELKCLGFTVDIFERSRLLGGKATSFTVADTEVDNGQHVFLACCTEFIDFVRQVEQATSQTGKLLWLQERFDALLLARGRPPARLRAVALPAPWHLAPALARYPYLATRARLEIARALLAARRPPLPGETFAAWLERHHQSVATRTAFWKPFIVPALNAPLEDVAAEMALFVIVTAFLQDAKAGRFGFARVPLGRIAAAAATLVDSVSCRAPVARLDLTAAEDGFAEPTLHGIVLEDGRALDYDAVVLAVPPDRLSRLLGDPAALGVHGLDSIRTAPIVDVHLWYDTDELGFGFAALLDSPVQWVFEKGPGYLCCSMSAANAYGEWPVADLVELCCKELEAAFPRLRHVTFRRGAATRDHDATFVPSPGLRRPGAATRCQRVVLAGAWTDTGWPATMESAVRSGRTAARMLAARINGFASS